MKGLVWVLFAIHPSDKVPDVAASHNSPRIVYEDRSTCEAAAERAKARTATSSYICVLLPAPENGSNR